MPLEFLESAQWFRRSEGGLEIAPPPSGARYKNTPVGRGLSRCAFRGRARGGWGEVNHYFKVVLEKPFKIRHETKNVASEII